MTRRATSRGSFRSRRQRLDPRARAVVLIYVGVLLSLVVGTWLLPEDSSDLTDSLVFSAMFVAVGLLAVVVLGRGSLRASFAGPPRPLALLLGPAVGLVAFGFSWGYVHGLLWLFGIGPVDPTGLSLSLVITMAVLPALVEEWTDRGVLWLAIRPLVSERMTILATALVFAFMHGLDGSFLLGFPHRFTAGLLLGWLRARTGSIVPCILAHFLHNFLSLVL